ncbi:hypothetical protein V6N11_002232 [Hibiscus sabdariffa]|uniref:Uncharacterized protein n=1 Tax=Hibiscus sabdariffa TaxID=183260 RepID=A0ABR2QVE9_9ROSI
MVAIAAGTMTTSCAEAWESAESKQVVIVPTFSYCGSCYSRLALILVQILLGTGALIGVGADMLLVNVRKTALIDVSEHLLVRIFYRYCSEGSIGVSVSRHQPKVSVDRHSRERDIATSHINLLFVSILDVGVEFPHPRDINLSGLLHKILSIMLGDYCNRLNIELGLIISR